MLESLFYFPRMWQGLMMMISGIWSLPLFLCIHDYSLYANLIVFPCFLTAARGVAAIVGRKEVSIQAYKVLKAWKFRTRS